MAFGVTAAGFIKKEQETILQEMQIDARLPANFGSSVDLSEGSPIGVFIGLMAGKDAEKWDIAEDTYYQNTVDNSTGVNQDRLYALRNVNREPAKRSIGTLTYTGAEGSVIPLNALVENAQGIKFETTESETIPVGGTVDVLARSVETGITGNVPSLDINIISTAIPGVTDVINNDVFQGGAAIETDPAYRARYKSLVGSAGNSAPVIQLAFEEITDVISASVLENNTDFTVGNLTPHSINAIIEGGTDQEIGAVFLQHKLTGIETIGAEVINVVDGKGIARLYRYDRPTNIDIFVEIDITIDLSSISVGDFTSQFTDGIKFNTINYIGGTFQTQVLTGAGVGSDIEAWRIVAAQDDIPFIIGDIIVRVGKTVSPTGDRVDIEPNERGQAIEANIVLNIS